MMPTKNSMQQVPKTSKKQRLLQTNCHIGIIGSGLAGLSSALAILRSCSANKNTDVDGSRSHNATANSQHPFQGRITIYERDAHLHDRKEGYGMTLTYDPKGPLAKLGVLEDVAKRDCPSRCHYMFNERGEIRGYFGNAFYDNEGDDGQKSTNNIANRGAGQRGNLRIPRSELRSILLNALMAEAADGAIKNDTDIFCGNSSSKVQILWNKRLLSYADQPMMEKLNQIHNNNGKKNVMQHQNNEHVKGKAEESQRPVLLNFDDGTTDEVDLLIGADGVNSLVARQYLSTATTLSKKTSDSNKDNRNTDTNSEVPLTSTKKTVTIQSNSAESAELTSAETAPRYLGIFIILGISDHFHPLIDERGFYTLDGTHRLFIMPFQGSRLDDETSTTNTSTNQPQTMQSQTTRRRRRTMWQLSYPISDKKEAIRLSKLSHEEMQKEVLKRCGHWHEPFPAMVKETPLETIWGTSLLDRDPQIFLDHRTSLEIHGRLPSRVVLLGDAAHSMTPFKGQGANQALADGPLLAKWLSQSKLESAVRGFMTEMARRSGVKVRASREAALKLHSKDCWEWMVKQDKPSKEGDAAAPDAVVHGVQAQHVSRLLNILKDRGVVANLGSKLDGTIRSIIQELNIADTIASTSNGVRDQISSQEMSYLQSQALEYASTGNISQLRQLSRKSHLVIPNALDANQCSCLHLAAKYGHVDVCRWLLSEVNVSLDSTACELAAGAGSEETVQLFKRWMDRTGRTCEDNGRNTAASKTSSRRVDTVDSSLSNENTSKKDVYRHVEQQIRGVRTMKQLHELLKKNRGTPQPKSDGHSDGHTVTHVLGCHIDANDAEHDKQWMKALAEEHGAVLLRNFISREVDQLALGVLALRPMRFDISSALDELRAGTKDVSLSEISTIGSTVSMSKSERKRTSKHIEEIKSQMTIPADASVIVQTNFGPQMQSYSASENNNASKKRKINSFPLSRLRYINLGEWNYNWGDRRYDKVKNAMVLPDRLVLLAKRAHEIAKRKTNEASAGPVSFDMAICNLYHLQRPSDRLGGHQDNVESNLSLPLVTISLGAPGVFLLGGSSREDIPTAILLQAGDCMVMSGRSRGYFHGIPTILSNELDGHGGSDASVGSLTVFPELSEGGDLVENADGNGGTMDDETPSVVPSSEELRFVKAFLTTVRMNMSIRQV